MIILKTVLVGLAGWIIWRIVKDYEKSN